MARTSNLFYTPSPYEDSVVVVKKKTANDILLDSLGVEQKELENINTYVAQKQNQSQQQTQQTETKTSAKKDDPFLEGFDDPYGEKAEQERLRKEQERKERLAKIRANADKRTWVDGKVVEDPTKTDPFLDGFNGTSKTNEQRVKFPNTQLYSSPESVNAIFSNAQLHTSPYKKSDTQFSESDAFREGFNDPYGEKEKEEKSKWQKVLDGISTGLTAASFIPGLDTFTNIAQIPVDLLRGDFVGAGLDLVGAIPFVGEIADIGKTARTADRIIDGVRATDKLVDGVKVIETVDDTYDTIKTAEGISDTIKAVETTTDAAKGTDTLKTVLGASDDSMTEIAKGSKDTCPVITVKEKTTALREVENLPPSIQRSAKSFYKRGSNHYNNFSLTKNGDNTYTMIMEKPGNVPGSKAVYYKIVDNDGNLIKVYKDTFDPYGKLIHRKDK